MAAMRAFTLITSWLWLAVGVFALLALLVFIPRMAPVLGFEGMGPGVLVIFGIYMTIIGALMVALPATFVLAYSSRSAKETFERKDAILKLLGFN